MPSAIAQGIFDSLTLAATVKELSGPPKAVPKGHPPLEPPRTPPKPYGLTAAFQAPAGVITATIVFVSENCFLQSQLNIFTSGASNRYAQTAIPPVRSANGRSDLHHFRF